MSVFLVDNTFVFNHIPKTGGASIRKGFLAGVPQTKACRGYIPKEWLHFPSIAIVRHPLDRFISAYHMLCHGYNSENKTGRYGICKDLSLEEFSDLVLECQDPGDGKRAENVVAEHCLPQSHPYNLIQRTKKLLPYIEHPQAVKWIADQLNIKLPVADKWNTTKRKEWSKYPIPQRIREYYDKDMHLYMMVLSGLRPKSMPLLTTTEKETTV